MRLSSSFTGETSLFDENELIGEKKFTLSELCDTKRMEIWVSDFKDKGDDFTLYRLYDFNNTLFAERMINGY